MPRLPSSRSGGSRGRTSATSARPGAAAAIPLRLIHRVPWLRRWTRASPPPVVEMPAARWFTWPRRLLGRLRTPPVETKPPWSSKVLRRVRAPLQRTARVVQAARQARLPRTRWERLREAAALAMRDPTEAARWERLMGLSVALARPRRALPAVVAKRPRRDRWLNLWGSAPTPTPTPMPETTGMRGRLQALRRMLRASARKDPGAGRGPGSGGRPGAGRRP